MAASPSSWSSTALARGAALSSAPSAGKPRRTARSPTCSLPSHLARTRTSLSRSARDPRSVLLLLQWTPLSFSFSFSFQGSHSTKVEAVLRTLKKIQVTDPGAKCLVFSTVMWRDNLFIIDKHPPWSCQGLMQAGVFTVAERPGHHRQSSVRQQHGVLPDQRNSQVPGEIDAETPGQMFPKN